MRFLTCGDSAVLVELDDLGAVLALHAELAARTPPGVVDLVPAARTLLLRVDSRQSTVETVTRAVAATRPRSGHEAEARMIEIPVVYDGDDLAEVGRLTGLGERGVVEAHTGQTWKFAFAGFAPGFAYLIGEEDRLHVPRRANPRIHVPAGAVGLAGEFSGVYPRQSPGGWQLLGRTSLRMWDLQYDPPALLTPGVHVRFVEVPGP